MWSTADSHPTSFLPPAVVYESSAFCTSTVDFTFVRTAKCGILGRRIIVIVRNDGKILAVRTNVKSTV